MKGFAIGPSYISSFPIRTIAELLQLLDNIEPVANKLKNMRVYDNAPHIVFRGQPKHENWHLLPKLMRKRLEPTSKEELISYITHQHIETALMKEFKRLSPQFLSNTPKNDLEWLALAQHHGLATRLLDWTRSPLTALFFAVNTGLQEDNCEAVVWAFTGRTIDGEYVEMSIKQIDDYVNTYGTHIYSPPHFNARFVAQNGCFTVHSVGMPLEESLTSKEHKDQYTLFKIIIPDDAKPKIREELERMGVNHVSLFPDLDGLSRHLNTWFQIS
jgi:hypothetical protein